MNIYKLQIQFICQHIIDCFLKQPPKLLFSLNNKTLLVSGRILCALSLSHSMSLHLTETSILNFILSRAIVFCTYTHILHLVVYQCLFCILHKSRHSSCIFYQPHFSFPLIFLTVACSNSITQFSILLSMGSCIVSSHSLKFKQ